MTNFTFDIDDIYRNETIQRYDIHDEHLNYKKWSCDDQFENIKCNNGLVIKLTRAF